MAVSVWADDQWLVEHAGATLKNTEDADDADEDGEKTDAAAEMESQQSVEAVSKHDQGASYVLHVQN